MAFQAETFQVQGDHMGMDTKPTLYRRIITGVQNKLALAVKDAPALKAFFSQRSPYMRNLWVYNAEKTLGALGPERDYLIDVPSVRSRGRQFSLDNEVAQMIIKSMEEWVIGNGLTLSSEPNDKVLKQEGITIDAQQFSDEVEARISVLKEMRETSYSGTRNFSQEEKRAFTASNNGGAVLCILRVVKGIVNVEVIDGIHIKHPAAGTDFNPTMLEGGNRICNGIELSPSGEHIAYWVLTHNYEYDRIVAKSQITGLKTAFLYGGIDAGLDNTMPIPILAGLFQTLQQMDDYKTTTLASAKSQNDIAYQVTTELGGNDVNVLGDELARAQSWSPNSDVPRDINGQAVADKVRIETGKESFALGVGQEIKPLAKNEAELYFEAFWKTLFECVCAAAGMPPNVVIKRFDTSFSSARAAIKDWQHSLFLKRYTAGIGFNQPWFELQLHIDILLGKISAPGYLKAFSENNIIALAAYRRTRWVGDNVPEIDELKEVKAMREALGTSFDHVPLISMREASQNLGYKDQTMSIKDSGEDLKSAASNGFKPAETAKPKEPGAPLD